MSGLFLVGLYPLHFLFCSWVLYMTVWLRPLECWAQSPLCLRLRLPSTNALKIALSPKPPSRKDQSQDTYFSAGTQPSCWGLVPKTTVASPVSSLGHGDYPNPPNLCQRLQAARPHTGHPDGRVPGPDRSPAAAWGPLSGLFYRREIYFPEVLGQEKTCFLEVCQKGGNPPRKQTRPFSL